MNGDPSWRQFPHRTVLAALLQSIRVRGNELWKAIGAISFTNHRDGLSFFNGAREGGCHSRVRRCW